MNGERIVESENHVSSGPTKSDNFMWSKRTGDNLRLKGNGKGSYLMQVGFPGGEVTQITVDSGAEQFATEEGGRKMKFTNASGGIITHFGKRNVKVVAPF